MYPTTHLGRRSFCLQCTSVGNHRWPPLRTGRYPDAFTRAHRLRWALLARLTPAVLHPLSKQTYCCFYFKCNAMKCSDNFLFDFKQHFPSVHLLCLPEVDQTMMVGRSSLSHNPPKTLLLFLRSLALQQIHTCNTVRCLEKVKAKTLRQSVML